MSARSYLSIGDVLTLLRQEFPDVTISKIRFLESQGLVNPERTPSGYRKFYEQDVERLRWVLRQQREHFLPLKVIKDRLDDDPSESEAAEIAPEAGSGAGSPAPVGAAGRAKDRVPSRGEAGVEDRAADSTADRSDDRRIETPTDDRRTEEPVLVGHRVSTEHRSGAEESRSGRHAPSNSIGSGSTLPGIETAGGTSPAGGGSNAAAAGSSVIGPTASSPGASVSHGARGVDNPTERSSARGVMDDGDPSGRAAAKSDVAEPTGAASGSGSRRSRATPAASNPGSRSSTGKSRSSSAAEPQASAPGAPLATNGATEGPDSPRTKGGSGAGHLDPNGASLSLDELSAACGLDVSLLRELQEYGLLTSASIAGVEYFDEEALAVANLSARFARYGIEPRHLRLYKNAAEREAGFVEQIVLPLVRQRNPEARARAHETADELTQLGQQLRGSLLRTALGNLLNG
ncbi:MAG TPA: MerR family transcriptional regulator [Acidimicrobiales bacterium]|nr:MerR family transcriptional regulator [Acidimicrobiales bacterium]